MAKITYKCPNCGLHDVSMDATAKWDDDSQKWVHSGIGDYITCLDCWHEDHPESFEVTL